MQLLAFLGFTLLVGIISYLKRTSNTDFSELKFLITRASHWINKTNNPLFKHQKSCPHLAEVVHGKSNFVLYSLSTFFLELEQEKATKKLVGRQMFQSGAQLEKYLPDTAISI